MQLLGGQLVRTIPALPAWLPLPQLWVVAIGLVLVLVGAALLVGRWLRPAARVLAALLVVSFVVQRIPEIVAQPGAGYVWTNPAKVLALLGGALTLAAGARPNRGLSAALVAAFFLLGGAQHFVYAGFVDTLVPAWIPPNQRFWTIFAGVALIAGGAGLLWPRTRRLAGLWSGVMIFLWVLLLHVPRAVEMKSAFELAGVFEALALAGVAWLVAGDLKPAEGQVR